MSHVTSVVFKPYHRSTRSLLRMVETRERNKSFQIHTTLELSEAPSVNANKFECRCLGVACNDSCVCYVMVDLNQMFVWWLDFIEKLTNYLPTYPRGIKYYPLTLMSANARNSERKRTEKTWTSLRKCGGMSMERLRDIREQSSLRMPATLLLPLSLPGDVEPNGPELRNI